MKTIMTETELQAVNLRAIELVEESRRKFSGDTDLMLLGLAHRIAVSEFHASQRVATHSDTLAPDPSRR